MNNPSLNASESPLILASASPYRRELLARLNLPFETFRPDIDESPRPGESPTALARRLSIEKAEAARRCFTRGLAIGSDQVCVIDGEIHGKPGDHDNAFRRLKRASGKWARFLTGLCLFNIATGECQAAVEPCAVLFKTLDDEQIARYLAAERPWHCAGAFKSEGLGVALIEKFRGDDPNALIGLPLIRLIAMLEAWNINALKLQREGNAP